MYYCALFLFVVWLFLCAKVNYCALFLFFVWVYRALAKISFLEKNSLGLGPSTYKHASWHKPSSLLPPWPVLETFLHVCCLHLERPSAIGLELCLRFLVARLKFTVEIENQTAPFQLQKGIYYAGRFAERSLTLCMRARCAGASRAAQYRHIVEGGSE